MVAPGADLRTDLPRYAVYRSGERLRDVTHLRDLWRPDLVAFLIGSGITFDDALERAARADRPAPLGGALDAPDRAGRPLSRRSDRDHALAHAQQAIVATQVSSRFPQNHGAPIHIGDPAAIGADLARPLFGPPVERVPDGLVAVFWACGVTPQQAALEAKVELLLAHSPAHGFISAGQAGFNRGTALGTRVRSDGRGSENGRAFFPLVIASDHRERGNLALNTRLLRRCASRNDTMLSAFALIAQE